MEERLAAWKFATDAVAPIIEKHGLEDYSVGSSGATIFNQPTTRFSKVEQEINETLKIADWLLGGNN